MTAETTFDSTQDTLEGLLREVSNGKIQLPDFQRGWVWDDHHIRSIITSVSRSFPIGAVMLLQTGGEVRFQPRLIEGVEFDGPSPNPDRLILDGQQRLTSLYQALKLERPILTRDHKRQDVTRWYYVDINKALGTPIDREAAVFSVPGDRQIKRDFGREIVLDLTTVEREHKQQMFPLHLIFQSDHWFTGWMKHWNYAPEKIELFNRFRSEFIDVFRTYSVPVIQLRRTASKEAVCLVFEKVNTGGVALTAFELLTATYAADGFNLREDWYGVVRGQHRHKGRFQRLCDAGPVLRGIENTDFLQAVTLLYTAARRSEARQVQAAGRDLPAISCTRQAILDLPLEAYNLHAERAEQGFRRACQFLWREKIFRAEDLPYRTQLVPLATILFSLGDGWQDDTTRRKVRQWYWSGVFGELYGGAIESRFARDLAEVVAWALDNGPIPQTILDCNFSPDRLPTLRTRLSAAYKGLHALIMQRGGARDWRTGAEVLEQTYFDETIDIHHIFPRAWCEKKGIQRGIYNSIVNKTALSAKTNRLLGGDAPSVYLRRLQDTRQMAPDRLDSFLATHFIEPTLLRRDDIRGMMVARARILCDQIAEATGRPVAGTAPADIFAQQDAAIEESEEEEMGL